MVLGTFRKRSPLHAVTSIPLYACEEQLCWSRYSMEYGYFVIVLGEEIKRNGAASHKCPHDEFFMYISSFDAQTEVRVWKCSAENCSGSRMERYAAA
jgi:hypothetical protein